MSKSYATRRQRPEDSGPRFVQRPFAPARVVQAYSVLRPQDVGMATSMATQDIKRGRYSGAYRQSVTRPEEIPSRDPDGQSMVHFRITSVETQTGNSEVKFGGGLPELKVSENKKLAINNAAAQPKEFFAEPAEVTAGNTALAKVGSNVRLKTGSGFVKLPGNATSLVKVEPGKPSVSPLAVNGIEKLVSMVSDECNDVIDRVVGGAKRVVVLAEHGFAQGDRTEIPTNTQGVPPDLQVRDYLGRHPDNANAEAAREHTASFNWDQVDQQAINAAHSNLPGGRRQEQARSMGLNEFAEPQVGEGYVIKSEFTPEFMQGTTAQLDTQQYLAAIQALQQIEPGKDVTSQQVVDENVRAMMSVWGVHYAGVVARDGADTVTLENYNRIPERDWEVRRIFNNLFEDFADFRQYIADKAETLNLNYSTAQASRLIKEVNDLHKAAVQQGRVVDAKYSKAVHEAQESLANGLQKDDEMYNSLIHFQMYGPGDQSFHSAFKGMTSNPVTYRTRASVKEGLADQIEDRAAAYVGILRHANLGPKAARRLEDLHTEMTETIKSFATTVRTTSDDDSATLTATQLANYRANVFADPKLAQRLYRCYCDILGDEPGDPPATRPELVGLIDVKLDEFFVRDQTKAYLRALRTLINALPDHLTW